jgi:hypothetical protein
MPQIIVTAGPTGQHGGDIIMLRERVNPDDFESEQFAANLVERLGWAVSDATETERRQLEGLAPAQAEGLAPVRPEAEEEEDEEPELAPDRGPFATV